MNLKSVKKILGIAILIVFLMNFGVVSYGEEAWLHITLETNHENTREPIMVKMGTLLKEEILPELEGEEDEFLGWFFDKGLTEEYEETEITEDITLYAKWSDGTEEPTLDETKEDTDEVKKEEDLDKIEDEKEKEKEEVEEKVIVKQNQIPSNVPNVTIFGEGPIPMEKLFDEPIMDTDNRGTYITGYKDGTFRPNDNVTREEFAAIIYRTLKDDVVKESSTIKHNYTDITNKDYEEAIATLSSLNIINGYKDNTFKPINYITRGEVAVILARVNAMSEAKSMSFSDVDSFWGKGHISAIADKGWIEGYSDGTFRPRRNIKRSELVRMVNNALGRVENGETIDDIENNFVDIESFRWYYFDVLKASNTYDSK